MLMWLLETFPELNTKDYLDKKSEVRCEIEIVVSLIITAISFLPQSGYTPLLVACEYKKVDIVTHLTGELAEKGLVDVAACCQSNEEGIGMNGLHLAALHDSKKVAELFVKIEKYPLNGVDKKVCSIQRTLVMIDYIL